MSLDINVLRNITNKLPLDYDDPSHSYKVNGTPVPGVTTVAGEMLKVEGLGNSALYDPIKAALMDASTLQGASERGTRVHKAVEEHIKKRMGKTHDLDGALLDLKSPNEHKAFDTFLGLEAKAGNVEYLNSELKMGVQNFNGVGHGLAGTMDIFALVNGQAEIWDIKAGQQVPETVGIQTAAYEHMIRENTGYTGPIKRRVAHVPAKGNLVGNLNYTQTQFEKSEHIKDTDLASFSTKLSSFGKTGKQPIISRDEVVKGLAGKVKANKVDFLKGDSLFGWIDANLPEDEAKNLMNVYFDAAHEAGVGVAAKMGNTGLRLNITNTPNPKLRDAIIENSFKKKVQPRGWYSNLKSSIDELKSLGDVEIGETLEGVKEISGKVGSDLLSAISRTDNLRYAAIGGAIGYAGGLAYGALHDTSDPTSTYHEERHLLGNAIKGAAVASVTTYAASAAMNMRNVESSTGDMVAHVGTSAKGFVKGASDVIMGAWRSTGRMR